MNESDDDGGPWPAIQRVLARARERSSRERIYREEVRTSLERQNIHTPVPPAPSASAPAVAVPEPVAAPVEAVPVTPQGVQKRVMVTRHVARWPAIETDMKGAATNGLAAAAKAGARGWREAEALAWAESKGRLMSVPKPGSLDAVMGGVFTSIRHTLDG